MAPALISRTISACAIVGSAIVSNAVVSARLAACEPATLTELPGCCTVHRGALENELRQ
jgi:hypothetical protein